MAHQQVLVIRVSRKKKDGKKKGKATRSIRGDMLSK